MLTLQSLDQERGRPHVLVHEISVVGKLPRNSPIVHSSYCNGRRRRQDQYNKSLSMDDRMNNIMEVLLAVKRGQQSLQKTFDSKIDKLRKDVMATIDDKIKAVKVDVDLEFASLDNRIVQLERALSSLSIDGMPLSDHTVNNCDVTVIVSNLRKRPSDIPLDVAKELVRALGDDIFRNTNITDVKRCDERAHGKPPVLKIAFESVEQKVNVLRAKQKLKQSQSYKNVYMHGSKTHTERILELNAKTLLSELPNGNQYRVTANGQFQCISF